MGEALICLTSKMSHGRGWRDSCASTRRDRPDRWLWRLVRPLVVHHTGINFTQRETDTVAAPNAPSNPTKSLLCGVHAVTTHQTTEGTMLIAVPANPNSPM